MTKKKETESFEKSLHRLEEIAEILENEEIGLDESIQLYEEGIKLSKICYNRLKDAELKITELKSQLEKELGDK
jgi:exodeoxyribonuclease VII small subunit